MNYGGRGGKLSNGFYNVVALQNLNYIQSQTTRAFGNFQADYKILKNLTYKFVFAPEYVDIMEDKYLTPLHGDGKDEGGLSNWYASINNRIGGTKIGKYIKASKAL